MSRIHAPKLEKAAKTRTIPDDVADPIYWKNLWQEHPEPRVFLRPEWQNRSPIQDAFYQYGRYYS